MNKVHTTLTVDNDILQKAKNLKINLSNSFEGYLSLMVNSKNNDIEGINIELLRLKTKEKMEEMTKIQAEIRENQEKITLFEKNQAEKKEKILVDERKRIENTKKCVACNQILNEIDLKKAKAFGDLIVCKGCFMTSHNIERWLTK